MNATLSSAAVLLLWQLAAPGQETTIRGRVLDKDGQPIKGASVRTEFDQPLAQQGGNGATSDADGRFEITSVSPGKMLIRVDPPLGLSDEWHVTAVRAGRSDVTSGSDLAPGSTTEITIVVSRK